jgi:hypothetical protein
VYKIGPWGDELIMNNGPPPYFFSELR